MLENMDMDAVAAKGQASRHITAYAMLATNTRPASCSKVPRLLYTKSDID